jgi:tetratricopeptide (TPR) repeat protein
MGRYFISYSRGDGASSASRLYGALQGLAGAEVWMDAHNLPAQNQFGDSILAAIAECDSVLFVWTRGSAQSDHCKRELDLAERYIKPVVVLQFEDQSLDLEGRPGDMDMYQIAGLSPIVFTDDFPTGFGKLRRELDFQRSAAGRMRSRIQHRNRVQRILDGTKNQVERRRARDKLQELDGEIACLRAESRADGGQSAPEKDLPIEHELDRPEALPGTGRPGIRYVKQPPPVPRDLLQFQDRKIQTERLAVSLQDEEIGTVVVSGNAGIGKTAMVSRFLQDPSITPPPPVHSIVYLSAEGAQPMTATVLVEDIGRALLGDTAQFQALLERPDLTLRQKLEELIYRRPDGAVAGLVIDSLEELLDDSAGIRNAELDSVLDLLLRPDVETGVKLILVTRTIPEDLLRGAIGGVERIALDKGLPLPDARKVLARLDADGRVGLALENQDLVDEACRLTSGHPRALEALYGALRYDNRLSLADLVSRLRRLSAEQVVDYLILETFNRLYWTEQRVLEALAIYEQPVPPPAIDYLLKVHFPDVESERTLQRLADLGLVREDGPRYYLPLPDRELVLGRVAHGEPADRDSFPPPFSVLALLHRAADYFVEARQNRVENLDDLWPQLREIDLRVRGQEFTVALELLEVLDETYLARWGQSVALMPYRESLVGTLDDQRELINLAALGDAEQQCGAPDRAIGRYRNALDIAQQFDLPILEAKLRVNLGSALYRDDQLRQALASYEQALAVAKDQEFQDEEASALLGIGMCHAEIGGFTRALQFANRGLQIVCREGLVELEATILLDTGIWYGQLGQTHRALERLGHALQLARQQGRRLIEGKSLSAAAEVLIDQGRIAKAIDLAEAAARIGRQLESPELVPEALASHALALLCAGALDRAKESADLACKYRRPRQTLRAPLLQGIIALRQGDRFTAERVFPFIQGQAVAIRVDNGRRFDGLDAEGLACCGIAVTNKRDTDALDQAVRAFRSARSITVAAGVINRTVRLLEELEDPWQSGLLDEAHRAASGLPRRRLCVNLEPERAIQRIGHHRPR